MAVKYIKAEAEKYINVIKILFKIRFKWQIVKIVLPDFCGREEREKRVKHTNIKREIYVCKCCL